ncbi:CotH kinase family protein, partial [Akkermansiaceae bacterium]|nr:CotH kinase family protein [Akkermansiaceae bacterium]
PTVPRAENPAYERDWDSQLMTDDGIGADQVSGDGVYSAILESQPNRTLVRYRITVEDSGGETVRVPYADDERMNFAYFQYDGIPDYRTNVGTFSSSEVQSVPVYHVLTTSANFNQAVGYNGSDQISRDNYDARSEYNWNCTFVYEGKVFDNMKYRLRQRNARYSGSGKRSLKFRFNRGNYPTFRDVNGDKYDEPWKFLSTHKMLSSRSNYYTWGLFQATNHLIWNLTGTPAPYTHWGHFRIVQGAEEYTTQHVGDYYGMLLAMEEYDSRFLDSHDMEKGNLYKLISGRTNGKDVQRYQGAESVANASDFSTIINQLTPARDDNWLREQVNWDSWNRYHAVVDMIRHYDVRPNRGEHLKNRAYYFEPSATNPRGRLNVLPWDSDTSWGPNWNDGMDFPKQAIFGSNQTNPVPRGDFGLEYFNTVREMRDLVWTEEQISLMIDPLAAKIDQLVPADRARWLGSPNGSQNYPPIEPRVADMKKFAFIGRDREGSGEIWTGGNNTMPSISQDNGASGDFGRDAYLDALVADASLPAKPEITYSGDAGFPQDGLSFKSSDFSDPQGANTFQSMEWRLAEVTSLGGGVREIMAPGRIWSYQDNNIDEGVAWREVGFDDSGWKTGAAPLGFGRVNGINMATTTTSRIPTAYFRTTVNVNDLNLIEGFLFKLLVDDGAVVYVNGQEAFRDGFDPDTVVGHDVLSDSSGNESDFDEFEVNPDLFVEGENVIAIEVHNTSLGSNDMGFEMSLDAQEVLLPPGENPSFEWTTTWESGELTT